jgi:hypothetical protein
VGSIPTFGMNREPASRSKEKQSSRLRRDTQVHGQSAHATRYATAAYSAGLAAVTSDATRRGPEVLPRRNVAVRAIVMPMFEELGNVRPREASPDVLRMYHDPEKQDDLAIAPALAANQLLDRADRQYPAPAQRSGFSG